MLTIVVDRKTGKVYEGTSAGGEKRDNLSAKTKHSLGGQNSQEKWAKDNCSEIDALDKARRDGAKDKNLVMHTKQIDNNKDRNKCKNCQHSNGDIQTTSECSL